MENIIKVAILILIASLPPLTYLIWIGSYKKREKYHWYHISKVFIFGMTISFLLSLTIEVMILHRIERPYLARETSTTILLALVIAPFTEEFTKGLGFLIATREINKIEDGLIYGVAIGLGFSLPENLMYEWRAFATTFEVFILTVFARSISSILIHASTTAITGYGVVKYFFSRSFFVIIPFYLIAVGLHSLFNLISIFGEIYGRYGVIIFAFSLAIISFGIIKYKMVNSKL